MPGTRKLGRPTAHRTALLRGMVTFLLEKGRIETTVTRAKEVSALTEKLITIAKEESYDVVLIDTAGRLHVDDALMQELVDINDFVQCDDILLTVDAMTGQDIVKVAQQFQEKLPLTGLVVTKFDGDSRGGGVLSVRAITQVPVKFVCLGEKIEDIDVFCVG